MLNFLTYYVIKHELWSGGRMKAKIILTVVVLIMGITFSICAEGDKGVPQDPLGPSDLIEISVLNHPNLNQRVNIRPDGRISYPLIGEVYVLGISPAEVTGIITQKLSKYIRNPIVSVNVLEYRSKKILVIGEVKTPGLYQYEGDMTVMNAIGLAGGYKKHAELKNILVVRNASYRTQKPVFYLVNLYNLIHDANTTGNIGLKPGDIVYIPLNAPGNIGEFMDYYLLRIQPAAESYGFIKD